MVYLNNYKHFFTIFRKKLHEKYPKFANLFSEANSKNEELQLESNGRPTAVEYSEKEIVNIEFGLLKEEFWNSERPCFVKEEHKILNVIHAL